MGYLVEYNPNRRAPPHLVYTVTRENPGLLVCGLSALCIELGVGAAQSWDMDEASEEAWVLFPALCCAEGYLGTKRSDQTGSE